MNDGLSGFAARLDWKGSIGLAVVTAFIGAVFVPALLSASPLLRTLGVIVGQFSLLTAFVFACLAVARLRR